MFEAEARMAMADASVYLQRIAQGWVHQYPVRYDAYTAEVQLPGVELVMTADGDSLTLRLAGESKQTFDDTKDVVAKHVDGAVGEVAGLRCLWNVLS